MSKRTWLRTFIVFIFLFIVLALGIDAYVSRSVSDALYANVTTVPHRNTALLLGTNKYYRDGSLNKGFVYRVEAAALLFKKGKVDSILVSGTRNNKGANEVSAMAADLAAIGVPPGRLILDDGSLRTLHSITRCVRIYRKDSVILVSQHTHNERALYLARHAGLNAIAFDAKEDRGRKVFNWCYEKLARLKMLKDLIVM